MTSNPSRGAEARELAAIPYDEAEFRTQAGLVPGAQLLKQGPSPVVQVWRLPSLTVNAIQASSRLQAGNIINDSVWAKVTVRLVPEMNPERVLEQLKRHLQAHLPWGLEIHFKTEACNGPWATAGKGPAFEAAEGALKKGYGHAPYKIGTGGSIPFVQPFADALGGVPALLIGVEDPYTNAHGENESLLISDFKKACLSQVYLFENLGQMNR